MSTKAYINDEGTAFFLDVETTITDATGLSIAVKKPLGSETIWTGVIEGTTEIKHIIEAGDFDEDGKYLFNALLTTASGSWTGETAELIIYKKFT